MAETRRPFVPAAGHDLLLPFYDPLCRLLRADNARRDLIEQAGIEPGQRVLEIGCGTGSVLAELGALHPDVEITGLDPDPKALARARRKLERAGLEARLDEGYADALPYPDDAFDRVLSSLMLHHLEAEQKRAALREVRRVLRPGGSLHVMDFGGGERRSDGLLARLLHSSGELHDHYGGGIVALLGETGFSDPTEVSHRSTLFGRVGQFRGGA